MTLRKGLWKSEKKLRETKLLGITKGNFQNMTSKQLEAKIYDSSLVVAAREQISSDLGQEVVILNLQSGVYHGLNEVGARVWNLIEQPKPVKELKQTLAQEYEVEPEVCTRDLLRLLHDLKAAGLIEVRDETGT